VNGSQIEFEHDNGRRRVAKRDAAVWFQRTDFSAQAAVKVPLFQRAELSPILFDANLVAREHFSVFTAYSVSKITWESDSFMTREVL
jgi:hypothetical protein